MTDFPIYTQIPQLLQDWIPETASIAIADQDKYVVYRAGTHDIHIEPGDVVRPGSIADLVFSQQERVESEVDESVFGIPYHGVGYPLLMETGLESVLTVILPPRRIPRGHPLLFVMGHAENLWRPVPVGEITHFESYQKKTWFHTMDKAFTTNDTIQSLEERLPANQFLRIHRSYIINIASIDFIQRDDRSNLVVTLKNPEQTRLPVAQTYVKHVRGLLGF